MKNAKVLGKFKDEMKGIPVEEFVALRPKMYSIQLQRDIMVRHHNLKKAAAGKTEPISEISKRKGLPKKLPEGLERLLGPPRRSHPEGGLPHAQPHQEPDPLHGHSDQGGAGRSG